MAGVSESAGFVTNLFLLFMNIHWKIPQLIFSVMDWCIRWVAAATDLEKRISDAFLIFDHQGKYNEI